LYTIYFIYQSIEAITKQRESEQAKKNQTLPQVV